MKPLPNHMDLYWPARQRATKLIADPPGRRNRKNNIWIFMLTISRTWNIPVTEVYGTATFYSFLECKKWVNTLFVFAKRSHVPWKENKQILLPEDMLKIKVGETTQDRKFTLWKPTAWDFVTTKPLLCWSTTTKCNIRTWKRSGKF